MSSYKIDSIQGMPVLSRAWKDCNNKASCTAFTLIWNFISWGSVLLADGGKISVNGTSYQSFSEAYGAHPIAAAMFIFPVVGIIMLYHTAAIWMNKTQIKIDLGFLEIKKGPIFWMPSSTKIPLSDIKEAYVQEYTVFADNENPITRYRMMVQRVSSGECVLESGIVHYADAQILEKWLEENISKKIETSSGEVVLSKAS